VQCCPCKGKSPAGNDSHSKSPKSNCTQSQSTKSQQPKGRSAQGDDSDGTTANCDKSICRAAHGDASLCLVSDCNETPRAAVSLTRLQIRTECDIEERGSEEHLPRLLPYSFSHVNAGTS
jgi:hypothetical protein